MRIAQLLTQARGGPVDHAVDLAVELARLGHDSHVVGPSGAYAARLAGTGVSVHHADIRSKHDVVGTRAVAGVLRRIAPDVVHLQDRRAGFAGRALGTLTGQPTVYTLHGVPDPLVGRVPGNLPLARETWRDRAADLAAERLLARAPRSRVVVPCEALADYARDHVGIPAGRVRTVHNGVTGSWLAAPAAPRPRGPVTAVWLGLMQPVKRVVALVRAAADVADLRLVLVGDGPQRAAVEAAIAESRAGDRITLTGFTDDPARHLRSADFLVHPSAAEACPMAVLQAMACGLPVLATSVGGVPEIVRDGIDGLLVPAGDDDELREALRLLAKDEDARRAFSRNGRRRVEERFTAAHCAAALVQVYREVAR